MQYVAMIAASIAVVLAFCAGFLNEKLIVTREKLALTQIEKTALETEVKKHNEESLYASEQIAKLRQQIQSHKDDSSDGYRCLDVAIPVELVQLLHGNKKD